MYLTGCGTRSLQLWVYFFFFCDLHTVLTLNFTVVRVPINIASERAPLKVKSKGKVLPVLN
jgi:hypothetical protein